MPDVRAYPIGCFAVLWLANAPAEQAAAALDAIRAGAAQASAQWPRIYRESLELRIITPKALGEAAVLAVTLAAREGMCPPEMIDAAPETLARSCDLVVLARAEDLALAGLTPALILPNSADGALAYSEGRVHPLAPDRRHESDILPSASPKTLAAAFAPPSDAGEAKKLAEFLEEPGTAPVGHRAYNLLLWLIGQGQNVRGRRDTSWDRALAVAAQSRPCARAPIEAIQAAYGRADALAMDYGDRWRSTLVSRSLLLLMMNALCGLVGALEPKMSSLTIPLQIVVTALTLYQIHRAQGHRWRAKWLDYRRLAEALRVERFLVLCGVAPASAPSSAMDWIAWTVRRVVRNAPPAPPLSENAAPAVLKHLAEMEVAEQIAYHEFAASRFRRLDHGFGRAAMVMPLCFVALGANSAILASTEHFADRFKYSSAIGLALTWAPALYALLEGVRRDLDTARQSERSTALAANLKDLAKAIAASPATVATAQPAAARAAQIMREDVARWRNVVEVL